MTGILAMATADIGDLTLLQSSTMTVSSTYARTGTYSYRQSAFDFSIVTFNENAASGYGRICARTEGAQLSFFPAYMMQLREGTTPHLTITVDPWSGTIEVFFGGSFSTAPIATAIAGEYQAWDNWEFYWTIDNSSGNLTIKWNGVVVVNYTGDTRNGETGTVNNVLFGGQLSGAYGPGLNSGYVYFDDIIFRTDQWCYRGGLYVLQPNAGTSVEQWTPSTGNPEDCVDELPPSFTDYIYTDATVDGTQQLVNIESLPEEAWNIRGVGVHVQSLATESTDAFIRTMLLPGDGGASIQYGADWGVETYAIWCKTFYTINPADSAVWEDTDIDDLQIGVETVVQ